MHNGSGVAPVLRCWGGSNFLLCRWKFNLRGSTSKVFSLGALVVSPSSASFHPSCQFLLRFLTQSLQLSNHISPRPIIHSPILDFQARLSPKGASHHFHHNIFPLAPSFSLAFWILGESWLLKSAVTTPIVYYG